LLLLTPDAGADDAVPPAGSYELQDFGGVGKQTVAFARSPTYRLDRARRPWFNDARPGPGVGDYDASGAHAVVASA
jgi:hypothetical protein